MSFLQYSRARVNPRPLFLIRFPAYPTSTTDRDRHRCPYIFRFILRTLAVSVVSFRSPHLRERRKSGRDRLLPSCRRAPIGIPRRRVGSAQVAYVPRSRSQECASERVRDRVLLLKWRNSLSGSGRPRFAARSACSRCATSKKGRILKTG